MFDWRTDKQLWSIFQDAGVFQAKLRVYHRGADVAGLIEGLLGDAAVNQTQAALAGSLASLYRAALAHPALALEAVPSLLPDAVTSLWSLLGNALREAAKSPPVVSPSAVCSVPCSSCRILRAWQDLTSIHKVLWPEGSSQACCQQGQVMVSVALRLGAGRREAGACEGSGGCTHEPSRNEA